MRTLTVSGVLVAFGLGLAACSDYDEGNQEAYAENETGAYAENEMGADYSAGGNAAATAGTGWPAGSRIVVEEGVTYRVEPSGVRVRLGPEDSRIVVEEGVRFRVDPDGRRVRIDEQGAVIDVDGDDVDANVNLSGNTSVSVNTQ